MSDMAERYERAAGLLPEKLAGLMRNRRADPTWTGEGDRFWYERQTEDGVEYALVDPEAGTRQVAASLAELGVEDGANPPTPGHLVGPDGRALVRRDHDLWIVDADGGERRLTTDGEEAFAWGALPENTNMVVPFRRMGLVLPPLGTVHSPSGRRVFTLRTDERALPVRHMVEQLAPSGAARPEVHAWRVGLEDEGDPAPTECRIIDLDTGASVDVDVTDRLGAMVFMNGAAEVTWSADETRVYLLHYRVGGSSAALVEIDTSTGNRRDVVVLDEGPLYEVNQFLYSMPLCRVLPESGEAILFSQRDDWGHLYLYDLATGACKNRISAGEIVVRDLLHVDVEKREVTYAAGTSEGGLNPYQRRIYRAGFDGESQQLLTPEPCDHDLVAPEPQFFNLVFGQGKPPVRSISPSGRFFVDHQSTVSEPPVIVLRDADARGDVVLELERTDVSRLLAAGYVVPSYFCVKADDGVTDLWGVRALPADPVDPGSIPVVEHVYAGFQITHTPAAFLGGGRTSGAHGNLPSWNALGFATVMVDGRGAPGRDRTFRQWTFQQFHTGRGLEDHVTALRALAADEPRLDLDRVGVVGHSYGGYNAARMILMFPELYRAAISSAGVHDAKRMTRGQWDWHLGADLDRDSEEYAHLGNLHLADRLEGDLLLCCGEIDENATLDHTFAMADALMRTGKRFDLKIWPGLNHYQLTPYVQMAFWDHFTRSLLGEDPPRDFAPTSTPPSG